MMVNGLNEYSKNLKSIRVQISDKLGEIRDLENNKKELWDKLLKDLNDNKISFKKQEGLTGLESIKIEEYGSDYRLYLTFTNRPTAKGLSIIEEETGLSYWGNEGLTYMFTLS